MTNLSIIEDLTLVPLPVWWQNPWFIGLVVLGLGAAAYVLARWWRKRSRLGPPLPPPPPGPPPHLEALRRLAALRGRHAELDAYGVATECSDILRHYIEARFVLPIRYQTTLEFLGAAQSTPGLTLEARQQLGQFLNFFDPLKFARASAPGEQTLATVNQAEEFVRRCIPPGQEGAVG